MFLAAIVASTMYGGLSRGAFTVGVGWLFSNVACLHPIGELSLDGRAFGLLFAYMAAALVGVLMTYPEPSAAGPRS